MCAPMTHVYYSNKCLLIEPITITAAKGPQEQIDDRVVRGVTMAMTKNKTICTYIYILVSTASYPR